MEGVGNIVKSWVVLNVRDSAVSLSENHLTYADIESITSLGVSYEHPWFCSLTRERGNLLLNVFAIDLMHALR